MQHLCQRDGDTSASGTDIKYLQSRFGMMTDDKFHQLARLGTGNQYRGVHLEPKSVKLTVSENILYRLRTAQTLHHLPDSFFLRLTNLLIFAHNLLGWRQTANTFENQAGKVLSLFHRIKHSSEAYLDVVYCFLHDAIIEIK